MFVAIPFIILLVLSIIGTVSYILGFFLESKFCSRDLKVIFNFYYKFNINLNNKKFI